ncbi:MAG: hypothetical protein LIO99_11745 [Clostridiales bacterium]|nr:hypothetical protein [Clostridiales bacterium]
MRISITIIEDQKTESSALKDKILFWSKKTNSDVVFSVYASAEEFYKRYSPASDPTDIYFLDAASQALHGICLSGSCT